MSQGNLRPLFEQLVGWAEQVAHGDYHRAEGIFEMTRSGDYPAEIVRVAEAFGLLIVGVEAREQGLRQTIDELENKKAALEQLSRDLAHANLGMLEVLGSAIAKRDSDTSLHNYRVTLYAVRLAERLGLPADAMRSLFKGAFLHDVGKIGILDRVLLKAGPLDPEEFENIKAHVRHGADIIAGYPWLQDARTVVFFHHEKYDGSGYPEGRRQEDIPKLARIFAIADVFDALTSRRPYKEPYPLERALDILRQSAGTHFDPVLIDAFLPLAPALHAECTTASETALRATLGGILKRYFSHLD